MSWLETFWELILSRKWWRSFDLWFSYFCFHLSVNSQSDTPHRNDGKLMIILEKNLHFKSATIKINTAAASPHESLHWESWMRGKKTKKWEVVFVNTLLDSQTISQDLQTDICPNGFCGILQICCASRQKWKQTLSVWITELRCEIHWLLPHVN